MGVSKKRGLTLSPLPTSIRSTSHTRQRFLTISDTMTTLQPGPTTGARHPCKIIPGILATMASLEIRVNEPSASSTRSSDVRPKVESNLRTDWQRRNLGLFVTHPKVQEAADACSKLAKAIADYDTSRPLVVLFGNPGCGKTHL